VRKLVAVENANGFAITFAYDERGRLVQLIDSAKRPFAVQCDEAGRILTISTAHPTEPRQRVTLVAYTYNSQGELVSAADALAQAATYQYRERLLVQETFKNGLSFYFEYVGQGPEARCTRTWGDEGIYDHQLVYDLDARRTVVTNSLGHATTYLGNENGLVVEVQDARGGVTLTEYNEFNDLLSHTDALGQTTKYDYDERGNCLQTIAPDGAKLRYEYDPADQLVALTDAVGGQWQWTYDEAGNLTKQTNPTGSTDKYSYTDGLLSQSINASKHTISFFYDTTYEVEEMLTHDGQKSRWLYDGWGRMRKSVDARSNVQWCEYDLLGHVVTVHEPDGDVRRFTYDAVDNVTRTQDRHSQVQYAYRGMSRMIRRVEAGTNVEFLYDTEEQLRAVVNEHGLSYRFELDGEGDVITEVGFDGLTRRYQRDAGGRVVELELPSGQRTRYGYDPAGRVTEVQYGDGCTEAYTYRADGAMLSAANNTVAVTFERNVAGQVLHERQGQHSVSSVYNTQGNRTALTSSLRADVHYSRNEQGEITQMRAGMWQALFERDAQGIELHRTLSGGVHARWQRDTLGRPIEQRISIGLGQVAKRIRHYDWQAGGRIRQIQDSQNGLTRFEHDALGNLAATTFNDETRELRMPDAVGNLFTTSDRRDRRYGSAGQLLEAHGTRYEYDTSGNLIRKISLNGHLWQYSWNAAGHLIEVGRPDGKVVRFDYDALGRRVRKSYKDYVTHWVWDGDKLLHEWTELEISSGTDSADNLATWLFEESSYAPLAKLSHSTAHSIVVDHLGTPLQMYAANGEEVWEAELNSYGIIRGPRKSNSEECPFRYQGQYEDVETGLYYNRFRYYDPEIGQYISQDPIGMAGGDRFYGYVHDPSTWVDVLGLKKAPASLPNKPGIYILTNGADSYVGSAGIGKQGMNQRISSTSHTSAQKLLDKSGTKVQYVKVNMGSAKTGSDRNNILRYYEKREFDKQASRGYNMSNDAGIQSVKSKTHAEGLINQHGASASKRRTTCK
ncbi:MAG: RHS repeat protein, partial [Hymenobacter sp.]